MSNQSSNTAPSQIYQQHPPHLTTCQGSLNNLQGPQSSIAHASQLVAGIDSLSVSRPQGQATTQMPFPHDDFALQQRQQYTHTNRLRYASQHHEEPCTALRQGLFQNPVVPSQSIQHTTPIPAPMVQPTSCYPTQQANLYAQQQIMNQKHTTISQANARNMAVPQYTSHAQSNAPAYGSMIANVQHQNASKQSPAPSSLSNSTISSPATTAASLMSNNSPAVHQPDQPQHAHQPQQLRTNSKPTSFVQSFVQSHQPHSASSQSSGSSDAHPSIPQHNVLRPASRGQHGLQNSAPQNSTPPEPFPLPAQYPPSQAVQSTIQYQTSHQQQVATQPQIAHPVGQHQSTQQNHYQHQHQSTQSGAPFQNVQYHQNQIPLQQVYGAYGTAQNYSQNQGQTQNYQYQPRQAQIQQTHQQIQQQIPRTGQQQVQYQPHAQQVSRASHLQQQSPSQLTTPQYHQPQIQPQYHSHPPQNMHFMPPNAAQRQYNPQLPDSGQRQYSSQPQQQVYQPQIANAQFMPNSYKPPQAPPVTQTGNIQAKPAPRFSSDPMAATTSFLGKSYKSTTKFLGTKKKMKYAAGGAGVLLAGFLGAEMIDGLGDSSDAFVDGGSGGLDTGAGYDASGGGYENGASGGVDAGGSYAQTDVGGMADANSLAMQQALEQQGQMNAQALIGNDVVVQGGESISMAAGNTYV